MPEAEQETPVGTARNLRLNVRLSPGEQAAIERRARAEGMTISEFVRRNALQDVDRPVVRVDGQTLKLLYGNLRRAGGNLNQCSKELHVHHDPCRIERELKAAFRSVERASDELAGFISDIRKML